MFIFSKEWKPRFGHKRANDSTDKWLIEVPDQAGKEMFLTTDLPLNHSSNSLFY